MKQLLKGAVLLSLSACLSTACEDSAKGDAYISFGMSSAYNHYEMQRLDAHFKASGSSFNIPDTNDFILSVKNASNTSVYNGRYGDKPNPMNITAGVYEVAVYSQKFTSPAFSAPQFGDRKTVVVSSGESVAVSFGCTQLNSGMRLVFEPSFRDRFFSGKVSICDENYSLAYPYTEKRIAYFNSGVLDIIYTDDKEENHLVSRSLAAGDIYTLKLAASAKDNKGFTISIDTTRNWLTEDYTVGSGNDGSSMDKALKVSDLPMHIDAKDIWVVGYIVGGDVSSSKINLTGPFTKASHIAIAGSSEVSTREECAAIELPSSSEARETLNLMDHPENLGRKVYVKGNIINYYGHPGVKSVKEFNLK